MIKSIAVINPIHSKSVRPFTHPDARWSPNRRYAYQYHIWYIRYSPGTFQKI